MASGNKTARHLRGTLGWLALFACVLLAPTAAFADELQWTGVNGIASGGYYVSPYKATNLTTGEQLSLYCLDFNHYAATGKWEASINQLGENMSSYQYGGVTDLSVFAFYDGLAVLDRYLAAAWLFSQELNTPNSQTLGIYQYAAWKLLVDDSHVGTYNTALGRTGLGTQVDQALTLAFASYQTADLFGWKVVTSKFGTQEFLTNVPEPSAILLLFLVVGMTLGAELRRTRPAR